MIRLDHVNIRVDDQDALRDFLIAVAGLRVGPRPPFTWHGYWLYLGDQAVVHTGPRRNLQPRGEGHTDHFAFLGFDYDERKAALTKAGFTFEERNLPGSDVRQIFVSGPEGVVVELQCPPKAGGVA